MRRPPPIDDPRDAGARHRWATASRILAPHRIAIAIAMTLVFAMRVVIDPGVYAFLDARDLVLAAGRHALDLLPVSAGLLLAYGAADELLPRDRPWRMPAFAAILAGAILALVVLQFVRIWGIDRLPGAPAVLTQAIVWGTPAILCALITEADRRARRLDAQALAVGAEQARLAREESEQQLQLLQAQIEPHFLFNTLANLRRLYRTRPEDGARMFDRLQRYLHSALPQLRRRHAPLGDELALVEAYLELFRVRMGGRLRYAVDVPPALRGCDFPPVALLTLVENAIKHGLDPKPGGGRIHIRGRIEVGQLVVEVVDDGVGFGAVSTGGTGIGLANVRRRLATLHGPRAGLALAPGADGGVTCRMWLPAVAATAEPDGAAMRALPA